MPHRFSSLNQVISYIHFGIRPCRLLGSRKIQERAVLVSFRPQVPEGVQGMSRRLAFPFIPECLFRGKMKHETFNKSFLKSETNAFWSIGSPGGLLQEVFFDTAIWYVFGNCFIVVAGLWSAVSDDSRTTGLSKLQLGTFQQQ